MVARIEGSQASAHSSVMASDPSQSHVVTTNTINLSPPLTKWTELQYFKILAYKLKFLN